MNVRPAYVVSLIGSVALAGSGFMPWLRLGDVGLPGVPDPAGFFVLGAGLLGAALSSAGLFSKRDTRQILVLAGLAGLTTLIVVWRSGPVTVAERAQARADAIAIVDNVPAPAVPVVGTGYGLFVGLAGAALIAAAGLTRLRDERL
jgi:hypothetical protein